MWPANLALFIDVSTHCNETVKIVTLINMVKCLGSPEVTHQVAVQAVTGSIPNSGNDFYVCS